MKGPTLTSRAAAGTISYSTCSASNRRLTSFSISLRHLSCHRADQRQQKDRTNASNLDQYRTEGNVTAVERSDDGTLLLATIALGRDELLVVQIACDHGACPDVQVGDYLEADGEQGGREEQGRFIVETITILRNGHRVH